MGSMVLDAVRVNGFILPNLTKAKTTLTEAAKYGSSVQKYAGDSPISSRSNLNAAKVRNIASDLTKRLGTISSSVNTVTVKLDAKLEKAKTIEQKNKAKSTALSAAVGAVAGAAGAAIGVATGGVKGAVVGAAVGAAAGVAVSKKATSVISSVGKALKNTGAKIAKNVGNFFKSIGSGLKKVGQSIANACKKIANKVVSFVKEKIGPIVKKIGQAALSVVKFLGRTAATIANLAISLVEGICSFVEAIGDVVLLVVGAACSVVTAVADIVRGVCTGEWDWKCTSAVWKKWIMPWVGYDWTSKWAFSWASGSFIDNAAFSWAKRDSGLGYKIGKGVGYVVGIALATAATAGIAGAATGASSAAAGAASSAASTAAGTVAAKTAGSVGVKIATALANKTITSTILAGVGKMGKATSTGYNDVVDSQVKSHYIEQLRLQNPSLSDDELSDLFAQYKKEGKLTDYNAVRKSAMDNISGAKIAGVIGSGAVQGGIEAATWYMTYGGGGKNLLASEGSKLGTKFSLVDSLGKNLTNTTSLIKSGKYLSEGAAKVLNTILPSINVSSFTKAGIQVVKEYGNEWATVLYDGNMDWEGATSSAIVSGATSLIYDNTASAWMKKGLEKLNTPKPNAEDAAAAVSNRGIDGGASEVTETFTEKAGKLLLKAQDKLTEGAKTTLKFATKDADGKKEVGTAIKNFIKEQIKGDIKDGVGNVFDVFTPEGAGA